MNRVYSGKIYSLEKVIGTPGIRTFILETSDGFDYDDKVRLDFGNMKSDLMPAWYNALERKRALVSSYAYAFQDSFWWDERFYIFEMEFLKKGWFTIEGDDVEAVHLNRFVTENVLSQAYEYISDVLENPKQITAQEFMDFLDKTGLKQTADSHPGFLSLRE